MANNKRIQLSGIDFSSAMACNDAIIQSVGTSVDVLVIGAGPAGSTIARLLASWDYSVLLLRGRTRHPSAESVPPSIDSVLDLIGIRADVERAGFYPDHGSTIWWGTSEPRIEEHPGRTGYHLDRERFDDLLVRLAESAGAAVQWNHRAPRVALDYGAVEHDGGVTSARFVVDATGRSGLLARQIKRYWDPRYRTTAICCVVRANSPWDADPHHTLLEAYDRGWAWSAPLSGDLRHVKVMVNTASVRAGFDKAYRAELERTTHFLHLFRDSRIEGAPWIRDASPYYAADYCGPNWLLAGDAGSFADPISAYGIQKALLSAWNGAAVINTCLSHPDATQAAIEFFNAREAETWLDAAGRAAPSFEAGAAIFNTPFWRERTQRPKGIVHLPLSGSERFSLCGKVVCQLRPVIRGREIAKMNQSVLPTLGGTEYLQGIHLATLAGMAPRFPTIAELHRAYTQEHGVAPIAALHAALSRLLAEGVLQIER